MSAALDYPVRAGEVGAAGMMFYPRYLEIFNAAVEEWFAAITGCSFADMHLARRLGVPTARLDSWLVRASRLGDTLVARVTPTRVGRSSCAVSYAITGGGKERVRGSAVLVCIDLASGRSHRWPDDLRRALVAGVAIHSGTDPRRSRGAVDPHDKETG